jgi:hypothetical protein
VASGEALVKLHQVMCSVLLQYIHVVTKMARGGGTFARCDLFWVWHYS